MYWNWSNIRTVVDHLNSEVLPEHNLYLKWNHDQAPYILKAIRIVKNNVFKGGLLAVVVLLLFSAQFPRHPHHGPGHTDIGGRHLSISVAAGPQHQCGQPGRHLLCRGHAGGQLHRGAGEHRPASQDGQTHRRAAYEGTKEVYGAVIASTLTTVAVFLPVIFMREEAGQLFKDIAIAITAAILLSLLVSVTMIPTAMNRAYGREGRQEESAPTGNWIAWAARSSMHWRRYPPLAAKPSRRA
jgi:hydrophobic/amphiphilic exporter-1 (mainly G- bacteria), HAE1 family